MRLTALVKYVGIVSMFAIWGVASAQIGAQVGTNASVEARMEAKREAMDARASNTAERKEEVKEVRKENRAELEAKRDAMKVQVQNKRMELITRFAKQQVRIHQAAIDRLTKLSDRIEARINKSETNKAVVLTEAKAKLVIARAKITESQTFLSGIMPQVTVLVSATSTNSQTSFASVKELFVSSRTNLKMAHQSLVDVLSSIKLGLGIKEAKNATSTATTTP